MGLLIEGKWYDRWYDTKDNNGEFVREDSQFRSWITPDGSAGNPAAPLGPADPSGVIQLRNCESSRTNSPLLSLVSYQRSYHFPSINRPIIYLSPGLHV